MKTISKLPVFSTLNPFPVPEPRMAWPHTTAGQIARAVRQFRSPQDEKTAGVAVVIDLDLLSHGRTQPGPDVSPLMLATRPRVSDSQVAAVLADVFSGCESETALRVQHLACSPRTAFVHAMALTALPNNTLRVVPGLDGADSWLIERLDFLAHRREGVDGVVLVGGDHAYAPPVERLAAKGIPTCVISYPFSLAADLRRAAAGVVFL